MRSVRVLCVTPFGPLGRGGIDRLYYYLREFLGNAGMAGVDLTFTSSRGWAPGNWWMPMFPIHFVRIASEMIRLRPDIVHINLATGGSLPRKYAILKLSQLMGARTIVHFHGEFIEDQVQKRTLAGRLFQAMVTQAALLIALGDVHRRAFIRIGVKPESIVILPNGIPDFAGERLLPKSQSGPLNILFAGLLDERKGAQILIPALGQLLDLDSDWRCIVAGNGVVAQMQQLARDTGLENRITFTGWIEADALQELMRKADIVALPSRVEALPLSLIEGACAGAALVATNVGNISDIVIDRRNGFIIARDPGAVATALRTMITQRPQLREMQAESRRIYLHRFTIADFAKNLKALYLQISSDHSSGDSSCGMTSR
jgi:glycosyltransferase involved in cell wall biosynthesis